MRKLVLSLLFAASIVGVKAQEEKAATNAVKDIKIDPTIKKANVVGSNDWVITAGASAVDMRAGTKDFGEIMKDYIGTADLNFGGYFGVERSLNKYFSMGIGASFNKMSKPFGYTGNESDAQKDYNDGLSFMAFDGKLKYSFIADPKMFDPYIETGFGVSQLRGENLRSSGVNLRAGAGFNVWFSDKFGVNANSSYNHNFEDTGNDYFQHSLGLAYRFKYPSNEYVYTSHLIHEHSKWLVSFGANFLDVRTGKFDNLFKDYFNGDFDDVSASGIRASVERKFSRGLGAQLGFSAGKLVNVDNKYWAVDLKGTYDINNLVGQTAWFDPFINLGIGYSKLDQGEDNDDADFKINAGYGANFWLFENLGIKAESSYNHAFNHNGTDFFQHSAGLVYRFGSPLKDTDKDTVLDHEDECPKVKGTVEMKGCPDTDGDGVADKDDKCPEVKGKKELDGCPDEDNDGVADKDDECPKKEGPKENKGCPWPDTDGDGITDNVDKCPEVAGVESEGGCPKPEPVVVAPTVAPCAPEMAEINGTEVYFDLNKDYVKSSERVKLDRVVEIIKSMNCQVELIFLSGYADPTGPEAYNLGLSKRRAKAVHKYLTKKGVTNITVQDEGMGETNSKEDNTFNRRVEIRIN